MNYDAISVTEDYFPSFEDPNDSIPVGGDHTNTNNYDRSQPRQFSRDIIQPNPIVRKTLGIRAYIMVKNQPDEYSYAWIDPALSPCFMSELHLPLFNAAMTDLHTSLSSPVPSESKTVVRSLLGFVIYGRFGKKDEMCQFAKRVHRFLSRHPTYLMSPTLGALSYAFRLWMDSEAYRNVLEADFSWDHYHFLDPKARKILASKFIGHFHIYRGVQLSFFERSVHVYRQGFVYNFRAMYEQPSHVPTARLAPVAEDDSFPMSDV